MKLMLRCASCDQVKEYSDPVESLAEVEADDICMCCFECDECLAEVYEAGQ